MVGRSGLHSLRPAVSRIGRRCQNLDRSASISTGAFSIRSSAAKLRASCAILKRSLRQRQGRADTKSVHGLPSPELRGAHADRCSRINPCLHGRPAARSPCWRSNSPPRRRMIPVRETPVLIVGGGPVGLALAADLGWRGIECLLVEQTDGKINTPKMNEVNVRTMEFCRRWGIADKVINCPFPDDHPMDAVFVTSLGGYELARMERPTKKHQTAGPLSPMIQQICSQTWFDPILRELAQSHPNVTLRHRCRLETFEVGDGGVTAEIVYIDSGKRERVKARFLAACDGANSMIRRTLGIKLVGSEVLSRPFHMFFRVRDLFGKLGIKPGTFYLAIDRNGLWANIRVIDPVQGLWRLMVLDSPADLDPDEIDRNAYLRRALGRDIDVEWVGVSVWTRRGVAAEGYSRRPFHRPGAPFPQAST